MGIRLFSSRTGSPTQTRKRKYRGFKRKNCPHIVKYGIYGDAINVVGGFRLFCPDCGHFLDGPVSLATQPLPGLQEFMDLFKEKYEYDQ